MNREPSYLRYLEAAKQAEIAKQLRADGFTVNSEFQLGDTQFDLVAEKGAQKIAYEFRAGPSEWTNRESLRRLHTLAEDQGWQFRIVVVNPPPRVRIEIDHLQQHLLDHLMQNIPGELDQLSINTKVTGLSDIEISELHMMGEETRIRGTGSVDVELESGSKSGQDEGRGAGFSDSYPIHFVALLGPSNELRALETVTVDVQT